MKAARRSEMKKVVLIFLFCLLPVSAFAFRNEPLGFRGIRWGTHLILLTDLKLYHDEGIRRKVYERKNDKLKIGEAELEKICYIFDFGRFDSVIIHYASYLNHERLKKTLFEAYGEGQRPNESREQYYWFGVAVRIVLEYNEASEEGSIVYSYKGAFSGVWRKNRQERFEGAAPDL
jgi:hypothetical protein